MANPDFPGASCYRDRHGRVRWRYKAGKRYVALPGDPAASDANRAAYEAALAGLPVQRATVLRHPSSAAPRTLRAAWNIAKRDMKGDAATRARLTRVAERFLMSPVAAGSSKLWADAPMADLKRRHVKAILSERSDTPHAAGRLLSLIRKMVTAALDEEWIEVDPTHKIQWSPSYSEWRAWTDDELDAFERHWPVGTTARAVYAIAFWLGDRRSDVAALRWDMIRPPGVVVFNQIKTDEMMELPISDELWAAICHLPVRCETVLSTQYGRPFSAKSLTGHMAIWTRKAGLPPGCTIHGLRKTLGRIAADAGSTTHQIMSTLGHRTLKQAELYTREAERRRLARDAMANVVNLRMRTRVRT
jgi:integrase